MATTKKYLDLQGLQHLKEQKVLVKHPDTTKVTPAAVKVGHDADGHVVLGGAILPSDIGAAVPSDIGNATIKIKINGVEKDFTTNQKTNETLEWSLSDLGLTSAMHFVGTSLTALQDGATTSTIKIKKHNTDTTGVSHNANDGDVVLYNGKEFVFSKLFNSWYELGDQGSHALNTVTISGDGTYITGGGNLQANRTLSHKTYTAVTEAAVKVGRDAGGHVVIGGALGTANAGTHKHTITASVPASKFVDTVTPTSTKISLKPTTDTFIKSYPGVTSKLVTTTITGTNGTVTASKATAGTAVVYGTADVDTAVTGIAKVGAQITYGGANVGATSTVATSVKSATATATTTAYTASYANECLTLGPATVSVTPTVTLNTTSVTSAAASSTKAYVCADGTGVSITPAKAADTTRKITPYTFEDVTAAKVASSATTIATGALATDGSGATILTGLGTASTGSAIKTATIQSGTTGDIDVVTSVSSAKNTAAVSITASSSDAGGHNHDVI